MYARELERKLKKENLGLWINWRGANEDYEGVGSTGLYWNNDFVCGVPLCDMPERTVYNKETKRVEARGWKDIYEILRTKGYIR